MCLMAGDTVCFGVAAANCDSTFMKSTGSVVVIMKMQNRFGRARRAPCVTELRIIQVNEVGDRCINRTAEN